MIYTAEKIVDPVQFIQADPSLIDNTQDPNWQIVSGADIDVLVIRTTNPNDDEPKIRTKKTCRLLGELYIQGFAVNIPVGTGTIDIDWFPSPVYNNELSEELGLRPGEDVLRFTHAEHDQVPGRPYLEHIARGEFPQSTGWRRFTHDRSYDHAPGVFLMPAAITKAVKRESVRVLGHRKADTKRETPVGKLSRVDQMANRIDDVSAYIAHYAHVDIDEAKAVEEALRYLGSRVLERGVTGYFWADERKRQERLKGRRVILPEVIFNHIVELRPAIEAAKQAALSTV